MELWYYKGKTEDKEPNPTVFFANIPVTARCSFFSEATPPKVPFQAKKNGYANNAPPRPVARLHAQEVLDIRGSLLDPLEAQSELFQHLGPRAHLLPTPSEVSQTYLSVSYRLPILHSCIRPRTISEQYWLNIDKCANGLPHNERLVKGLYGPDRDMSYVAHHSIEQPTETTNQSTERNNPSINQSIKPCRSIN